MRSAVEKVARRLIEQRELPLFYPFEIHGATAAGQPADPVTGDPAPVGKKLQADQVRIPGKRRRTRIRRVAVSRRTQRQHLPDVLFGLGQKGDELVRGRPQIADASIGWQRAHMQQDSGRTLKLHCSIIDAAGEECLRLRGKASAFA